MHDNINSKNIVRILMLGDLVGKTGRLLFARHASYLKKEFSLDGIMVNGENCADDGRGITPQDALFLQSQGADVITTGNHIWDKKTIIPFLEKSTLVLRPANLSFDCPGVGVTVVECNGHTIGVLNVMGRVFMPPVSNCPFLSSQKQIEKIKEKTNLIFIDFHAQATAEKVGLAYFLDGKVTAVVGTHTHTQTTDEQILPGGTAYVTDLGMCGSQHSVLGFSLKKNHLDIATGEKSQPETQAPYILCGVIVTADVQTGKALAIERIMKIDHEPLDCGKGE